MLTCPKLNQARAPPNNILVESEESRQLSDKFTNFPGSPYGAIWMSLSDTDVEGVWRDHYSGQKASQDVLQAESGGLKENTDQNCGWIS